MMAITKYFLIGYMGSGKTETGKALKKSTGFRLLDMDETIEKEQHRSIPEIFEAEGEAGFRGIEGKLLARLCADHAETMNGEEPPDDGKKALTEPEGGLIVSCGGGIIQLPQNVELLAKQAGSVFLYGPPELLFSRIKNDAHRPNARADIVDEEERFRHLCALYERRVPLYRRASSHIVEIEGKSPDRIAAEILSFG